MARRQSIDPRRTLKDLFPDSYLEETACLEGFLRRRRKLNVVAFFWTLVLGFGAGVRRDVSSLRRCYERATGSNWAPSSFYDRLNTGLVRFLKAALRRALEDFQLGWGMVDGLASAFRDVVLADATVMRLLLGLRSAFPGSRTSSSPAAAKLHNVLSVRGKAYGGLSDGTRAALRAKVGADDAGSKVSPLARRDGRDGKPVVGTRLIREWHGERHEVTVVQGGFEYQGRQYRSLTAVAKQITGAHWNPKLLFGLRKRAKGRP